MTSELFNEKEAKILELDVRRKVYDIVKEFAGCHFREIERKSGLATGSARYHLNYLTKHGLINQTKEDNSLRYFPKYIRFENSKLLGLLRQKTVRKIILFILINNNCNHEQIVESAGISPSTATWHLKKLEGSGVIESRRKGREKRYKLLADKEDIINLLITYKGSFIDSLVDRIVEMWDLN